MDKSGNNSSQGASKAIKFGYDVNKHQIRSYSTHYASLTKQDNFITILSLLRAFFCDEIISLIFGAILT